MVLGPGPTSLGHLRFEGSLLLAWCDRMAESSLLGYVVQDLCLLMCADGHGLGFLASC